MYTLKEEHRARFPEWVEKWTKVAFRTGPTDHAAAEAAMIALYSAARLPPPRVVVVPSPVVAVRAYGIAAGIWYLLKHPEQHQKMFGRNLSKIDIMRALYQACAVDHTIINTVDHTIINTVDHTIINTVDDATRDTTYRAIDRATRDAIYRAIDDAIDGVTDRATYRATVRATTDVTDDAISDVTEGVTYCTTRNVIDDVTFNTAIHATYGATYDATDDVTEDATSVTRRTTDDVTNFLRRCMVHTRSVHNGGNQWVGRLSFLTFFRYVVGLPIDYSKWDAYEKAAEFGPRMMHEKFCFVSEYPEYIRIDDQNRPHCHNGPSHRWPDGTELFYWHGVKIPKEWILTPKEIDPRTAITWPNIEQRRALAEILGWDKILAYLQPLVIDIDHDPQVGVLLEAELDGQPSRFLRVTEACSGRQFVLPVPRECQTAIQANAETYGVTEEVIRSLTRV